MLYSVINNDGIMICTVKHLSVASRFGQPAALTEHVIDLILNKTYRVIYVGIEVWGVMMEHYPHLYKPLYEQMMNDIPRNSHERFAVRLRSEMSTEWALEAYYMLQCKQYSVEMRMIDVLTKAFSYRAFNYRCARFSAHRPTVWLA